jgi:hypothetical protein
MYNFIPKQLQKEEFRFVRVSKPIQFKDNPSAGKRPMGLKWQKTNNDKYDSERLRRWFKNGGNYGVISGFNDLIIIDIDSIEILDKLQGILPLTFSVKTRSGMHFYYICSHLKEKIILTNKKTREHYGEIQANGAMVVGPNSIHKSRKVYTIKDNVDIAKLNKKDLDKILLTLNVERKKDIPNIITNKKNISIKNDEFLNPIYKIKMKDLISINCNISHPFHASSSGANFSVSEDLAHCWRHNVSINPIQLLAMKSGYFKCEDVGNPHGNGKCKINYTRLTLYAFLEAIKCKLIPAKTKVPSKVLYYIAKKKEYISKDYDENKTIPGVLYDDIQEYINLIKERYKRGEKIEL